jgi:hypothetical protein
MYRLWNIALLLLSGALTAQNGSSGSVVIGLQPCFHHQPIALNTPLATSSDSITLETLRFYVGKFQFWRSNTIVFEEKPRYFLIDAEDPATMQLRFDLPVSTTFDAISFHLGTDSLTNVSGVMGGDLDPTKGMFWTWQSGYINIKIEGTRWTDASRRTFQYHLGGFRPPFATVQTVRLATTSVPDQTLRFDLGSFFEHTLQTGKSGIMSPGREAAEWSQLLSRAFSIGLK